MNWDNVRHVEGSEYISVWPCRINPSKLNLIAPIHPVWNWTQAKAAVHWHQEMLACIIHVLYCWCWGQARAPAGTRERACMHSQEAARAREHWRAGERIATCLRTFFHPLWRDLRWNNGGWLSSLDQTRQEPDLILGLSIFKTLFCARFLVFFSKEGRVVFRRESWCTLNTAREI